MNVAESVETFRDIRGYQLKELSNFKPSGINGLNYKKYKVTVEEMQESNEVYQERLQQIYDDKNSGFNIKQLVLKEASKIGVIIKQR